MKFSILVEILIISSFIKFLLFPAYHSTDFEVHRNWLRITYNLPLKEWYRDVLSIWTLDYPPFFAFFEWFLSVLSIYFDKNITHPSNLNYKSYECIFFQRLSVVIVDLLFFYSFVKLFKNEEKGKNIKVFIGFMQFGYILVDHIHFQYNSPLQGLLILSILEAENGNFIKSALLFTALLNFKHIFLYCSPAFFFYFLKNYCIKSKTIVISNFIKLVFSIIFIFSISFLPFLSSIPQIISRLFPFQRGLTHDFWAPNFWAIYCFLNRMLSKFLKKNYTKINECKIDVLPEITPFLSILIVILFSLFVAFKKWKKNNNKKYFFFEYCGIQSLIFFMFGFHVHEKAILIPLTLFQISSFLKLKNFKKIWIFSFVSGITLFPLLPFSYEHFICLILFFLYHFVYFMGLKSLETKENKLFFTKIDKLIIFIGLIILSFFIIDNFSKYETFFSRIIISIYGSLFNQYLLFDKLKLFTKNKKIEKII